MAKKKSLGRGLSALLENAATDVTSSQSVDQTANVAGSISSLPIENIEANPFQPRSIFEKEGLIELTQSIQEHGVIQPVSVRKLGYDKYQLISGERRFRASQLAGLTEIPAYIRIANDQAMLEMALVENIQRRDLNPIEVAVSYKRLIDECNLTQEQLGEKVSKNRTTVTNFLRLLRLPASIQLALQESKLSVGHARALVAIEDEKEQLFIFKKIIEDGLSVRQVETLIKGSENTSSKKKSISKNVLSFEQQKIQEDLSAQLNATVKVKTTAKGKGSITINFLNDSHLKKIIEQLNS